MAIKNVKGLLTQATALPAAVEAMLPAGAPKLSTMLLDTANKIPETIPDFPVELPDLPAVPTLPEFPTPPGGGGEAGLARTYVTRVEVIPAPTPARATVTPLVQEYTQPIGGVIGQVSTRRGM